jgi:hypothetical protein
VRERTCASKFFPCRKGEKEKNLFKDVGKYVKKKFYKRIVSVLFWDKFLKIKFPC